MRYTTFLQLLGTFENACHVVDGEDAEESSASEIK